MGSDRYNTELDQILWRQITADSCLMLLKCHGKTGRVIPLVCKHEYKRLLDSSKCV